MAERSARITEFLDQTRWDVATRTPLSGDASFRRYERLTGGPEPALLMDAPPPQENVRSYVSIALCLVKMGCSAPRVFAEDIEAGLLVIEDFGDATYTQRLANGADEEALYALAVDLLADLHGRAEAATAPAPRYDDDALIAEAELLVDWYLAEMCGPAAIEVKEDFIARWRAVFPAARAVPDTLVLKDYHVDNLMWLDGRKGVARCGLLDFQDAAIGPISYDLVSLLEDARRDLAPGLAEAMMTRYLEASPALDRTAFAASCAILGAQRCTKIIGIFTRLCRRDGKPAYLAHIPRVWRLLERDLAHPALAPVAEWFARHLPVEARGVPTVGDAA